VIEEERGSLLRQADSYRLLLAELRTENQELKGLVVELRRQVSVAREEQEGRQEEEVGRQFKQVEFMMDEVR
jgi:hypothetical protein